MNSYEFVGHHAQDAANGATRPTFAYKRVITVVREPAQPGSFAAHVAFAAKNAGLRVLMVDMTRDGLLTQSVRPRRTSGSCLSASQLFGVSIGGFGVEMLIPGFSLVRADARLIDAKLSVDDAATRLYKGLDTLCRGFEVCVIEVNDSVSVESLAAMQIAGSVMTTVCHAASKAAVMTKRVEQLSMLVSCSAVAGRTPNLTVLPLQHPVPMDLGDRQMATLAGRMVRATLEESVANVSAGQVRAA